MQKFPKISNGVDNQKGQAEIFLFLILIAVAVFYLINKPDSSQKQIIPANSFISSSKEQIQEPSQTPTQTSDNNPPYRFNSQPSGNLPAQTNKASMGLETDEKAVCRYGDTSGLGYYSMRVFDKTDATLHSTEITGLSEGRAYVYYVKCLDEHNNVNTDDFNISFAVSQPDDFTSPVLSNQYPAGESFSYDKTSVMIGISTNEPASCRYASQQGVFYNSMTKNLTSDTTKKYHTALISGLYPGQTYNYFVRCKDLSGNVNTGDVMIYFSIGG